jgi:hypothetical protein
MKSDNRDGPPQRRAESDQPLTDANETVENNPMKGREQPTNAESRPAERPDLLWTEHED